MGGICSRVIPHVMNWYFGWGLLLSGFLTGAVIGLFFHDEQWWGGYSSFRRRIVRLGHVAQAALGILNVVYSLSPWPVAGSVAGAWAGWLFVVGGVSMPVVCFLSGWKKPFRHLFFIPVASLMGAVIATLIGGG